MKSTLPGKTNKRIVIKKVMQIRVVNRIYILHFILEKSAKYLQKLGERGHESLLFWAGIEIGSSGFVTTCIYPPRVSVPSISFHPFPPIHPLHSQTLSLPVPSTYMSLEDGARMISEMRKRGLYLIAQIHSHPGSAFHSAIDDTHAFALYEGFLSIVVPNFGKEGMDPLSKCAIYRCEADGKFRRLTEEEINDTFVVLDDEIHFDI